jgi:DNA-binding protein WhiA
VSFSSDVKQELCKLNISRRCCAQAEAYGVLLFCNTFHSRQVRIITESPWLKERLPVLFRKAFHVTFDVLPQEGEGKGSFLIEDPEKLGIIFDAYGLEKNSSVSAHVNFANLEEEHCRTAFLRGAFLAGGSVTDPLKSYHLELATSHFHVGREVPALMQEAGFLPKTTTRKGNYITYFKQSEHIEDFLTTIGAPAAAVEIMTTKLNKEIINEANRALNCDMANVNKTLKAANEQCEAIEILKDAGRLDLLPKQIRETALLRLKYPELSLVQLAEKCDPPVTKSCINHRMRMIMETARELDE